ncbi:MAG: hypothetical protein M1831_006709 [Alyxoria varia]|nr:MAG: hypothetical protein M1831_006709 [Alyxoria varia]
MERPSQPTSQSKDADDVWRTPNEPRQSSQPYESAEVYIPKSQPDIDYVALAEKLITTLSAAWVSEERPQDMSPTAC